MAGALLALQHAGYRLIVVTNQSGLGRGLITAEQYAAVNARMRELLDEIGVHLTAIYHCPHVPEMVCACRKPNRVLFDRAATAHNVDLRRSAMVGDRDTDVIPMLRTLRTQTNEPWTADEVLGLFRKNQRLAYSAAAGSHSAPL